MADREEELRQMHEELLQRMELLDVLYAFAPWVQSSLELEDALQVTATTIVGSLRGRWCGVLILRDGQVDHAGFAGDILEEDAQRLRTGDLPLFGQPTDLTWFQLGSERCLLVPMHVRSAPVGWIVVGYDEGASQPLAPQALELARGIGRQAAIALENARMVLQIKEEQTALAAANAALKQREADLQILNARLAEATRLKSEFLAKMSHELRTPLNAIIGFSEAMLAGIDGPLNPDQRNSLNYIYKGGTDLLSLINDLLDLSKIEAGRLTIQPEDLVAEDLLLSTVEGLRPLAAGKGLRLELDVAPSLPLLYTDPKRLRQIVINLVGNAIKFTAQGQVRVAAHPWSDGWEIEVIDTGPGIPPDKLGAIFEEFTQLDGGSTRKEGGTGLGLSICKKLTELLGGHVSVASTPGVGSTFRVRLPFRYGEELTVSDQQGAGRDVLLVIDDDPAIPNLVAKALTGTRFRVEWAANGCEGLRRAKALRPAAIVLDLIMQEKDGWQVLEELQLDASLRTVPVVVLTVLEEQRLPVAVTAYLTKPFQPDRLRAILLGLEGSA